MVWASLKQILSQGGQAPQAHAPAAEQSLPRAAMLPGAPAVPAAPLAPPAPVAASGRLSLDAIGQRDEVIRQRVSVMVDRLEDLRTLGDDFSAILEPIILISDELPRATTRIAELEAAILQERFAGAEARQEAADLGRRAVGLANDLSEAVARSEKAVVDLRTRDEGLEELRLAFRDKALTVENLERQLFDETEQNHALASECKALRLEAQGADAALARSESDLMAMRERAAMIEQDNRRLQTLSEEQGAHLAELAARHAELEGVSDSERQRLRALETHLAEQIAIREQREAQHEVEAGALRTERSNLLMKLDAATSRAMSTDQALSAIRNQLREKDVAHRFSERNFKEASIARGTAERRLEALQTELARQMERFLEVERLRGELVSRNDMLTKVVATKDAVIDQANLRSASLSDRLEQQTMKQDALRADLETANRRLAEDLEKERAERALLQGALEVARGSRVALQKQHEALRRSGRGWRDSGSDGQRSEPPAGADEGGDASNVHPISFTGRSA